MRNFINTSASVDLSLLSLTPRTRGERNFSRYVHATGANSRRAAYRRTPIAAPTTRRMRSIAATDLCANMRNAHTLRPYKKQFDII